MRAMLTVLKTANRGTYRARQKKISHKLSVQAEVRPLGFSERGRRISASWPVILRSRARSTFAPSASLFRLSDFSALGTNRCSVRGWFFRRSKNALCRLPKYSMRGSPLGRLPVLSEAASEVVLPLVVERRLEFRGLCKRLDMRQGDRGK